MAGNEIDSEALILSRLKKAIFPESDLMIIQCRHCGTKFKLTGPERQTAFKVKCSLCATIFTVESGQESRMEKAGTVETPMQSFDLAAEKKELDLFLSEILKSRPTERMSREAPVPEPTLPEFGKQAIVPERDSRFSPQRTDTPENIKPFEAADDSGDAAAPISKKPPKVIDISLTESAQSESIPDPPKEVLDVKRRKERPEEKRKKTAAFKLKEHLFGISALIVLAGIAVFLWLYPQAGHQAFKWATANIPGLDKLIETKSEKKADPLENIQVVGLKQRFVNNSQLGKVRVIEGFILNRSEAPITKVKLMARLYDSRSTLLAAKVISCGGTLDDRALERLSEQEMIAALGKPGQSERIEPGGNIPFMFVFANEPSGISQAFVVPLTAERVE